MTITVGYKASAEQFSPRDLLEFAVLAEQVGFDSVMVSDHYQPWRHTGGHAPFALSWLAALGERTHSILLGTSVLTPTFRYNPAVVAQAFGTLASLYPDRVILGVGTGEAMNEVAVLGTGWPGFKERFERLREAIELIRRLLTEERVTFNGQYFHTVRASVYDRPTDPVPIYVAGGGPRVARYAGEVADGFICTSGKGMELYHEKLLPALTEGINISGRSPSDVARLIEIKLSFDTDRSRALRDTSFWAPLSLTPEQKVGVDDPVEIERLADQLPREQVARRWVVTSDADEALEAMRPYVAAGFDHLVFHGPGPDQPRFLKLFAEHIMPKIRDVA